jgi:hypothetical protein
LILKRRATPVAEHVANKTERVVGLLPRPHLNLAYELTKLMASQRLLEMRQNEDRQMTGVPDNQAGQPL